MKNSVVLSSNPFGPNLALPQVPTRTRADLEKSSINVGPRSSLQKRHASACGAKRANDSVRTTANPVRMVFMGESLGIERRSTRIMGQEDTSRQCLSVV